MWPEQSRGVRTEGRIGTLSAMQRLVFFTAIALIALSACRPTHSDTALREHVAAHPEDEHAQTRASFDLQCPVKSLELVPLDALSFGARGCGRQVRYQKACHRCQWTPVLATTDLLAD